MLNFLFPMNETFAQAVPVKEQTAEQIRDFRKGMFGLTAIFCMLMYLIGRKQSAVWLYFAPSLLLLLSAVLLTLWQNKRSIGKRIQMAFVAGTQGISALVMAMCLCLSGGRIPLKQAAAALAVACTVALALLVVGYHLHYHAELQKSTEPQGRRWSKGLTAGIVLLGIAAAKCLPVSLLAALLWGAWIWVHLTLSAAVLNYRKWAFKAKR